MELFVRYVTGLWCWTSIAANEKGVLSSDGRTSAVCRGFHSLFDEVLSALVQLEWVCIRLTVPA
jgi:hypothetical protein